MSNSRLDVAQRTFIDHLAELLTPWGLPVAAARIYGYLLIQNEPVSLDDMVCDLDISKSNASNAATMLESHFNARRLRERGSRRVRYVIGDDPGAPLRAQIERLGQMSRLIESQRDTVATGAARKRMQALADFHEALRAAMASVALPPG